MSLKEKLDAYDAALMAKELGRSLRTYEFEVQSGGQRLSVDNIKGSDPRNRKLITALCAQTDAAPSISGKTLELYLRSPAQVMGFADFVMGYRVGLSVPIHVDVDVDSLNAYYSKQKWLPSDKAILKAYSTKPFECFWNQVMEYEQMCIIGSPGYEAPVGLKGFRESEAFNTSTAVIGTKDQLKRYRNLAKLVSGDYKKAITESLKHFI